MINNWFGFQCRLMCHRHVMSELKTQSYNRMNIYIGFSVQTNVPQARYVGAKSP